MCRGQLVDEYVTDVMKTNEECQDCLDEIRVVLPNLLAMIREIDVRFYEEVIVVLVESEGIETM